jgi:hypothetical protein
MDTERQSSIGNRTSDGMEPLAALDGGERVD